MTTHTITIDANVFTADVDGVEPVAIELRAKAYRPAGWAVPLSPTEFAVKNLVTFEIDPDEPTIELEATGEGDWCWHVGVHHPDVDEAWERFFYVTADANFLDLVDLVPSTLDPAIPPTPAWAIALANHVNDPTAAHAATAISFVPGSGIAATDVQAAIEEVKADIEAGDVDSVAGVSPTAGDIPTAALKTALSLPADTNAELAADDAALAALSTALGLETTARQAADTLEAAARAAGDQARKPLSDIIPGNLPLDGLVAFWNWTDPDNPLRSLVGERHVLQQGAGASVTIANDPLSKSGKSAVFDGATDYLTLPAASLGALDVGRTGDAVTVIVQTSPLSSAIAFIAGMWDEGNHRRQYSLYRGGSSLFVPNSNDGEGVRSQVSAAGAPEPGGYVNNHIVSLTSRIIRMPSPTLQRVMAMTYDGTQLISYMDGVTDSFPTFTDPVSGATYAKNPFPWTEGLSRLATPSDFTVGAVNLSVGMGNFYTGNIGAIAIYNRALTAAEIMKARLALRVDASEPIVRLDLHMSDPLAIGDALKPQDGGYNAYLGTTCTDTTAAASNNGHFTKRKETATISYLRRTGSVAANVSNPLGLMFFPIAAGVIRASQVKSIKWLANHDGTSDTFRAVIRIGSTWYCSAATHSMPVGAISATDWANAVTAAFNLDRTANNWKALTVNPGVSLAVGATIASAIPNGDLTAIGILHENCIAGSRIRIQDLRIE